MSTQRFAATVLSLTASSQGLFGMSQGHVHVLHIMHQPSSTSYCLLIAVLMSWLECKWFDVWQSYFVGNAIGFSGVSFGLQV